MNFPSNLLKVSHSCCSELIFASLDNLTLERSSLSLKMPECPSTHLHILVHKVSERRVGGTKVTAKRKLIASSY